MYARKSLFEPFRQKQNLNCCIIISQINEQTRVTYLNSVKRDIVNVGDNTKQTVRESNKGSSQQKDEVIFIQTHLRGTVSAENK